MCNMEPLKSVFRSLNYTGLTRDDYFTRSIQTPSEKKKRRMERYRTTSLRETTQPFPIQGFLVLMAYFTEQSLGNKLNLSLRGKPTC